MKKVLLGLVLLLTLGMAVQAQNDNKAYREAMVKMMEVSKTMDVMKQMSGQIMNLSKQQAVSAGTQVPEEFWTGLESRLNAMYDRIIQEMIPIYQKYLTLEDVRAITKFYETPVGKKLAASNTQISMEAMPIAQKIAMETMQSLMTEMKEKGYIK